MKRKIVSLTVFVSFAVMVYTGVSMYLKPFSKPTASFHTLFGLLFVVMALFHIINNFKPITNYFKSKSRFKIFFMSRTLVFLVFLALVGWAGTGISIPGFNTLYDKGKEIRNAAQEDLHYQIYKTNETLSGKAIEVDVKYDEPQKAPQIAIWVEDKAGNYLQDLFVSHKLAKEDFYSPNGQTKRPEALPVWSHKRGVKGKSGLFVPEKENPVPDGMTGATPQTSYILESKLNAGLDSIRVMLEVNQSFDWNEYYHEKAFPEDTVYSGPGMVGQPALVYGTNLISLKERSFTLMNILGRAHLSGKDGSIRTDLQNITSALKIIDRVVVKIVD